MTTSSPATAGPITVRPLREKASSAFAGCSRVRSTMSGTIPAIAGKVNADAAPLTASGASGLRPLADSFLRRWPLRPLIRLAVRLP